MWTSSPSRTVTAPPLTVRVAAFGSWCPASTIFAGLAAADCRLSVSTSLGDEPLTQPLLHLVPFGQVGKTGHRVVQAPQQPYFAAPDLL